MKWVAHLKDICRLFLGKFTQDKGDDIDTIANIMDLSVKKIEDILGKAKDN